MLNTNDVYSIYFAPFSTYLFCYAAYFLQCNTAMSSTMTTPISAVWYVQCCGNNFLSISSIFIDVLIKDLSRSFILYCTLQYKYLISILLQIASNIFLTFTIYKNQYHNTKVIILVLLTSNLNVRNRVKSYL